jgi:hypothetical protein
MTDRITILLATCNGAAHLADQLASYAAQSDTAWDLWVSDDGSTDETRAIVERFRTAQGSAHDIRLLTGPRRGRSAANFLSLLCHPDLPAGPVALSDQDDVWFEDKLARARAALASSGPVTLYGAQSVHTDADLRPIGRSRLPRRAPSFANALTQNIVSGHSTVLSAGALDLVRRAGVPGGIPYHDWWLYQLISGAGGEVRIDSNQVLFYRQHGKNAMGAHEGWRASLARARSVMQREYGAWLAANMDALSTCAHLLTPEARDLLTTLQDAPRTRPLTRLAAFHKAGLYRQTRLTSALLYLAVALGRA